MKEYETRREVPRIRIPPAEKASAEEIERRGRVVARILERRRKMPPLGMSTAELLREVREEAGGD